MFAHYIPFYGRAKVIAIICLRFFFPLHLFLSPLPTLLLFRVMTAPTIKVFALLENVSLEFG